MIRELFLQENIVINSKDSNGIDIGFNFNANGNWRLVKVEKYYELTSPWRQVFKINKIYVGIKDIHWDYSALHHRPILSIGNDQWLLPNEIDDFIKVPINISLKDHKDLFKDRIPTMVKWPEYPALLIEVDDEENLDKLAKVGVFKLGSQAKALYSAGRGGVLVQYMLDKVKVDSLGKQGLWYYYSVAPLPVTEYSNKFPKAIAEMELDYSKLTAVMANSPLIYYHCPELKGMSDRTYDFTDEGEDDLHVPENDQEVLMIDDEGYAICYEGRFFTCEAN